MTKMDRPDGLGQMRVAAMIGLGLTAAIIATASFVALRAAFGGSAIVAICMTLALAAAIVERILQRRGRSWLLAVLLGLSAGSWLAAIPGGGAAGG